MVSVIVPAYNAGATLGRTLESVIGQTYDNLEILVVDDGSVDDTRDVASRFAARDPRVRVVVQENGGVARARNRGLRAAVGEHVAAIDADDLWHPQKIEKQLAVLLQSEPNVGFVYTLFRAVDENDRVLDDGFSWDISGHAFFQNIVANFVGNGSSLLVPRKIAIEVGGYNSSLYDKGAQGCEDVMLQLCIARRYPIALVSEYLVGYRQSPGMMSSNGTRMSRSYELVMEQISELSPSLPRQFIRWALGTYTCNLAIGELGNGHVQTGLPLLLKAFQNDAAGVPHHVSRRLLIAIRRKLQMGLGHGVSREPGRNFFEYTPTESRALPLPALIRSRLAHARELDGRALPLR